MALNFTDCPSSDKERKDKNRGRVPDYRALATLNQLGI